MCSRLLKISKIISMLLLVVVPLFQAHSPEEVTLLLNITQQHPRLEKLNSSLFLELDQDQSNNSNNNNSSNKSILLETQRKKLLMNTVLNMNQKFKKNVPEILSPN